MHRGNVSARSGFTLLEILVALVLIGLMVGTLLPNVLNQVSKGEINRLQEDLEVVSGGAKAFRVDVQRWPGDLEDLVTQPLATTADTMLIGGQYPAGSVLKWVGPYFELGVAPAAGIPTALGATILDTFGQTSWGGKNFFTVKVLNVTQADAVALSVRVDGDTAVAAFSTGTTPNEAAGKVRWRSGSTAGDTLIFLGAPVQ